MTTTAHTTTRAEIQAKITALRVEQRKACIPSTAREKADRYDVLLDQLLALQAEPVVSGRMGP